VRIPLLDPERMSLVKLHGIETHGIWIESRTSTNELMEKFQFFQLSDDAVGVCAVRTSWTFIIAALDSLSLVGAGVWALTTRRIT